MTDPIRIGNCSGFYGDRLSAVREMLEGGPLDVLTGDYLAELTMLILGRDRLQDPALGYALTFLRQAEDCLGLAPERDVKLVANAGGLNPEGLAAKLAEIAAAQGLAPSIAYVDGDDLNPEGLPYPDGHKEQIADPPTLGAPGPFELCPREYEPTGPTTRLPLGTFVHAPSGDKGGDVNLGLWVAHDGSAAYDERVHWLLALVTPGFVADLLPEAAGLEIDVVPLPNLGGANVVLHGLLGDGVAASTRFDPQRPRRRGPPLRRGSRGRLPAPERSRDPVSRCPARRRHVRPAQPHGAARRREAGSEISTHYDAMLAKVIAWAPTRGQAIRRLADALAKARIHGVTSNRDQLVAVLRSAEFGSGQVSTDLLGRLPMPGTVVRVDVAEGDQVAAGSAVVVLEAMKMQHTVTASHGGTVTRLSVRPGVQVAAGEVLAVVLTGATRDEAEEPE